MSERRNFNRVDRVGQQIHQILSQLLLFNVDDPDLQTVQITAVDVSGDLSVANVYYVVMAEDPRPSKKIVSRLERANGYLRRALGEELTIRHTPELRFKFDESIERGRRIEEVMSKIEIPEAPEDDFEDEDFDD